MLGKGEKRKFDEHEDGLEGKILAPSDGPSKVSYTLQRQTIFNISLMKLYNHRPLTEPSLQKTVLINNMLRRIQEELKQEGSLRPALAAAAPAPAPPPPAPARPAERQLPGGPAPGPGPGPGPGPAPAGRRRPRKHYAPGRLPHARLAARGRRRRHVLHFPGRAARGSPQTAGGGARRLQGRRGRQARRPEAHGPSAREL
uniref:SERTA domain-containing protein n=1 Tax=Canis lupus familiaris TaxID=9615 RepID=A0A8C0NN43_CANLF